MESEEWGWIIREMGMSGKDEKGNDVALAGNLCRDGGIRGNKGVDIEVERDF